MADVIRYTRSSKNISMPSKLLAVVERIGSLCIEAHPGNIEAMAGSYGIWRLV
jgi:hypothetical protein